MSLARHRLLVALSCGLLVSNCARVFAADSSTPVLIKQTPQAAPLPPATTQESKDSSLSTPGSTSQTLNSTPAPTSPSAPALPGSGTASAGQANTGFPAEDNYPAVAKMESLTFGSTHPELSIEQRLAKLESQIFKREFPEKTLFDRTDQLKLTLLGTTEEIQESHNRLLEPDLMQGVSFTSRDSSFFDELAERPENNKVVSIEELQQFALELINQERAKNGGGPLSMDPLAEQVAKAQVADLCKRNLISHANQAGDNPDRRYTVAGGDNAITESIVSLKTPDRISQQPTKAVVVHMVQTMFGRQDDRDSMLSPDATHLGFSLDWTVYKDRAICCTEVVTKRGAMQALVSEIKVGDKIEIKGEIAQPYRFERVTLAWEADRALGSSSDETDEALPYFPPLDYAAYAIKSDRDYSAALGTLRTVGIVAAIAGGMFVPPVALAAPLIAMSGGIGGDPKPVSDIPVHGGVKVDGQNFTARIPISNQSKAGMYYITVWASPGEMQKPIPVSRRAILVTGFDESVSAKVRSEGKKHKKDST